MVQAVDAAGRLDRCTQCGCLQILKTRDFEAITMSDNTYLTVQQTCDLLTISEATLRRYAASVPGFPHKIHLGRRRVVYSKADVLAFVARQREAA